MREAAGRVELDEGAEAEAGRLLTAALETAPARPGLAAEWGTAVTPGKTGSPASDPLGRVRKRAARERRRRVLIPAGATALAAAVAGGVTTGVVTAGGGAAAPSAHTALTAALVKTSTQSFTFTASASRHDVVVDVQGSVAGEFDPANGNGKEQVSSNGTQWQIRYIGAHAYLTTAKFPDHFNHGGKPWVEALSITHPVGVTVGERVTGFIADVPINPADLLAQLKSAAAVRVVGPASGPGWTGTKYSFTLADSTQVPPKASGIVSVDSAGRVRQLVLSASEVAFVGASAKAFVGASAKKETLTFAQTLTFGGFGTPVKVTAPPASQVFNAGNVYVGIVPGQAPTLGRWVVKS